MKSNNAFFIFLLGCIGALGPLSIDMYLPGFPSIAQDFASSEEKIGYTLTSYFIGISIGQLIYGPLLDRFGRKVPVLIGLLVYIIISLLIVYVSSLEVFVLLRFLQAVGVSSGLVASGAIVRDRFTGKESAKVFSSILLVMGVAPILAPTLGSFFVHHFGWRSIFMFLCCFTIPVVLGIYFFLDDHRGADKSFDLNVVSIFRGYVNTLKNIKFSLFSIASSLAMGILFTYISSISYIFMGLYEMNEKTFGILFALNAISFITGSQVNRLLITRYEVKKLTYAAIYASIILSFLFSMFAWRYELSLFEFCVFLASVLFCIGFVYPNATAIALDEVKVNLGSASAINGSLRMAFGSVLSGIMAIWHDGTMMPMIYMFLIVSLFSLLFMWAGDHFKAATS